MHHLMTGWNGPKSHLDSGAILEILKPLEYTGHVLGQIKARDLASHDWVKANDLSFFYKVRGGLSPSLVK